MSRRRVARTRAMLQASHRRGERYPRPLPYWPPGTWYSGERREHRLRMVGDLAEDALHVGAFHRVVRDITGGA
jgi:hypothetical protein